MNLSPIHRVLSTFRKLRVRALLMGGQACILYGAAEFSRDVDVAVLADERNLARLRAALQELRATLVFVPPLSAEVLLRGHACHFRCAARGTEGLRIDIMSSLHGCDPFDRLWARRHTLKLEGVGRVHVLALADLIQAKKTQRDKDWPMLRRLIEADYERRRSRPSRAQVGFWLREARTTRILEDLCRRYPRVAQRVAAGRPAVRAALRGNRERMEQALRAEQDSASASDRQYWEPLRAELARWRRHRERLPSLSREQSS